MRLRSGGGLFPKTNGWKPFLTDCSFSRLALLLLWQANYLAHQTSINDKRAWVGIEMTKTNIVAGQEPKFTATFTNSGSTPALSFRFGATWKLVDSASSIDGLPIDDPLSGLRSTAVVYPGGKYVAEITGKPSLDQITIDGIKRGALILVVFGRAEYTDVFHLSRQTRFCWFLEKSDFTTLNWCPDERYNYAR